jgi:hypothetical protein
MTQPVFEESSGNIFAGKREISKAQAKSLSDFFQLDSGLFI